MPRSSGCSARHVSSSLRSRRAPVRPPPLEEDESFFLEVELDLETFEDVADLSLRDEEDGIVFAGGRGGEANEVVVGQLFGSWVGSRACRERGNVLRVPEYRSDRWRELRRGWCGSRQKTKVLLRLEMVMVKVKERHRRGGERDDKLSAVYRGAVLVGAWRAEVCLCGPGGLEQRPKPPVTTSFTM